MKKEDKVLKENRNEKRKELSAEEREKMRLEKLKMASYCPRKSGLCWSHSDSRKE